MILENTVVFALVICLITISTVLVILAVSYLNMLKKYNRVLQEKGYLKLQEHKKETVILEEAMQKATKIIADGRFVHNNLKNEFQEQLKTVSLNKVKEFENTVSDFLKVYKQELAGLKLDTFKIVNNMTKDIEADTTLELKDFKEILRRETFASQKIVEGKIEEDYKRVEKEIEDYKKERLQKVEDHVYDIIQNVSKLILGKTLSIEEHERLILEALNKAKQEGVIA